MNSPIRLLVAAALLAVAVQSQDFEVRLDPKERVVPAGSDIKLVLTIDVKKDTAVPQVLLSGLQLDTKVGDAAGARIDDAASGSVQLTAGTKVQRVLTVPAARLALPPAADLIDVTVAWRDLPSATAVVKLAPDTTKIEIDDLDLAKTKVLLLTNHGQMVVRFFPDKAPNHVKNFIKLSKERFFDGTRFHRVLKGFMIQGGDPATKEDAGATQRLDYTLKLEPSDIKHERGILSMARTQHADSATSQFFICHGRAEQLDFVAGNPNRPGYSAFGILDSGFDTLDKIAGAQVRMSDRGEPSVPVEPLHLHAAIVLPVLKSK